MVFGPLGKQLHDSRNCIYGLHREPLQLLAMKKHVWLGCVGAFVPHIPFDIGTMERCTKVHVCKPHTCCSSCCLSSGKPSADEAAPPSSWSYDGAYLHMETHMDTDHSQDRNESVAQSIQ